MEYRVSWTIDIDADSPEEAAQQALAIQQRPGSWASCFTVRGTDGRLHEVDLGEPSTEGRTVHVVVGMDDGVVHDVLAFDSLAQAKAFEQQWLSKRNLDDEKSRENASDWGTGVAIWECDLKP